MKNKISLDTSQYCNDKVFDVIGVSYAGNPQNNTALFIGKKVEKLVYNLHGKKDCLVFIDNGIDIPEDIEKSNLIVKCDNPQFEYTLFAKKFESLINDNNRKRRYLLSDAGYYVGEDVVIGDNCNISRNVFIDHDVIIGNNVIVKEGVKLTKCIIGDNTIISENVVIGSCAPNVAKFNGINHLMPILGNVVIGKEVFIGVSVDIPASMASSTIVGDNSIIAANSSIGHDDHIGKNVIIASNVSIGGYVEIGDNVYIGLGATLKNRICIGNNGYIGMGSVVIRDVDNNAKVFGNPAKRLLK